MTVEGFKFFQDAEGFSAFDINAFLMSQSVTRFDNSTDRDTALSNVLSEGMVSYDKSTNVLQFYDGSAWQTLALIDTDHGGLSGLADDDHPQYLTEARGDARYYTETEIDALFVPAGSDGQVQYNNGGAFGAASALYYDDVNLRVGIGTTSPSEPLTISTAGSSITADGVEVITTATDSNPYVKLTNDARSYSIQLKGVINDNFAIRDQTAAADRLSIDSSGNVGIGTTSPNRNLHVQQASSGATAYGLTGGIDVESNNISGINILSPNTGYGRIYFASPVSNTAGAVEYIHNATATSGYMKFRAGAADRVFITGDGKVGIGDSTPSYTLDVNGTGRFTGALNADTQINLATSVHLTNVAASGSMRVQGNDGYIDIGPKNTGYCHIYTDRGSFYFNKTTLYANSTSNVIYHAGNSNNYSTDWTANSMYADNWFRATGNTGFYFQTYGTGIRSPISEGGTYGSVATYGGESGYEGFSIGGRAVFMHNMGTYTGIYNDVNNEWLIFGVHNGKLDLRYNGVNRLALESDRVENYSNFFETNATKFNHTYCGGGNNQIAFRWSSPYLKASVDNVTCATIANFSDERIKTNIVDWNDGMGIVRQLRPVTYTPKAIVGFGEISGTPIESPDVSNDTLIGLIAQEVGAVCPSAVARPGPDGEGLQSILPDHLFAILISAVKDIDSRLSVVEAA